MDDITDIIKNAQSGDSLAFGQLYEKYKLKALRTAFLITRQLQTAEDAVQETFIQCYREIGYLRNPESFQNWFYRILVRICWKLSSKDKDAIYVDNISNSADEQVLSSSSAEDMSNFIEIRDLLTKALNTLSAPVRTVLILHYYNDLSVKEIAKIINCFEGTVKSRLHKGRKTLFNELQPQMKEQFGNPKF